MSRRSRAQSPPCFVRVFSAVRRPHDELRLPPPPGGGSFFVTHWRALSISIHTIRYFGVIPMELFDALKLLVAGAVVALTLVRYRFPRNETAAGAPQAKSADPAKSKINLPADSFHAPPVDEFVAPVTERIQVCDDLADVLCEHFGEGLPPAMPIKIRPRIEPCGYDSDTVRVEQCDRYGNSLGKVFLRRAVCPLTMPHASASH